MIRLISLFLLLTCMLNASYNYKKIVVASFPSQQDADRDLKKIDAKLYSNDAIKELQKEHRFNLISRASGKYFIISVEPFKDKKVLIEVLRDIKKIRKDAFVNRFVSENNLFPAVEVLKVAQAEHAPLKTQEDNVTQETLSDEKTLPQEDESVKTVVVERIIYKTPISTVGTIKVDKTFYAILAVIVAVFLLLLVKFLKSRKQIMQLQQQRNDLEAMMKHKDTIFAKNIHELRTPIHGVLGMTHLLQESDIATAYTSSLDKIRLSANRMLQLVNDLLDLSKLEAQRVEIEHIEFNIDDVLETLSDSIGIEANKKGLDFLYKIENGLIKHYIGDPLRLSQILLNLTSNAIKFTDEGGVYVKIREIDRQDNMATIEFEVEDSGIGLSHEQQNTMFSLFSQSDKSTSRIYGGSGLGLAICKELVELMDGDISYKKVPDGNGVKFFFNIKLQILNPQEKRIYRLPSKKMMYKRAVVIDENQKNADLLMHKLEYFHYDVLTMTSLVDVIKDDIPFDILLLDETQLNENAISYLDSIREAYNAKIILIETLYRKMKNSKVEFRFDYRIIKPFTQQRIMDMVIDIYTNVPKTAYKRRLRDSVKEELAHLPPSKILLTEDNEINQKVILGLLKNAPIEVVVANNGLEALDALREHSDIALILMDLSMPIMDGYAAAKNIRKMTSYSEVPIVALSANLMSDEKEKIAKVGMQEYLPKPFEMDKFYDLLIRYLSD
ncbi:MAG: ATP-binding protein [Campylobacterota bacterium]|nr:ATP-binding protein [Campylobacterota bacterium]